MHKYEWRCQKISNFKRTQFNEMQYLKKTNQQMSADSGERTGSSESQTYSPIFISRFNKSIHFRLCPLPPPLHFSIPDPWSRRIAAKWGYRLSFSAPRAFARETKRKSPFDKKLWRLLLLCSATFHGFSVGPAFCHRPQRRKEIQTSDGKEKRRKRRKITPKTAEVSVWGGIFEPFAAAAVPDVLHTLLLDIVIETEKSWNIQFLKAQMNSDEAKILRQTLQQQTPHQNKPSSSSCVTHPATITQQIWLQFVCLGPELSNLPQLCVHPRDPPMFPLTS